MTETLNAAAARLRAGGQTDGTGSWDAATTHGAMSSSRLKKLR